MAIWHGYFGMIRNQTNLGVGNWNTLVASVDNIISHHIVGDPSTYFQKRMRLDNNAVIYEANFDEDDINFNAFKNKLATIFGIDPLLVTFVPSVVHLLFRDSVNVVYSYLALPRFTIGFFGRDILNNTCTWDQSKDECREYLRLNNAAWDTP